MRVILVDDEQLALETLGIQLLEIEGVEVVGKFLNPLHILSKLKEMNVDVVFLDMDMPEIHGLELAEQLHAIASDLEIVFVTAHPDFALEAFEVNAIDYLLKPVIQGRLNKTIKKLQTKLQAFQNKPKNAGYIVAKTFGDFQLESSQGEIIKWRTKKAKELFIYLWVYQEKGRNKERLIDDLWPNLPLEKASSLMHTTVYQLRKVLKDLGEKDPILSVNNQYLLNVTVKSDVSLLEEAIASTHNRFAHVEELLTRYTGDFLEADTYSWVLNKQHTIKESFLQYLEDFIGSAKADEEKLLLVEKSLEKMLKLDPYNESYLYLMIDHYGKTKNYPKMVACYESSKRVWQQELGLDFTTNITDIYSHYLTYK